MGKPAPILSAPQIVMAVYLTLLIAHILADFPLQVGFIYEWKIRSKWGLAFHVAIHILVVFAIFRDPLQYWPGWVYLFAVHFFIDWAKLRFPIKPQILGFAADQLWHALSLIVLAVWYPGMQPALPPGAIGWDLLIALISPVMLLFWTLTWDLQALGPNYLVSPLVGWGNRNLLAISQWVGFLIVAVVIVQIYF